MADFEWTSVLIAHAWQITLLVVVVAGINRWLSRRRPHLAHALWLVVLVKCVTPPLWSSPSGLFCWLQSPRAVEQADFEFDVDVSAGSWQPLRNIEWETEQLDRMLFPSDIASTDPPMEPVIDSIIEETPLPAAPVRSWSSMLFVAWLLASLLVIVVAVVRCWSCWRLLNRSPRRECPELNALLGDLAKKLRLKRRVRLIVTESRLGPAVIGLFRSTVLLPAMIVDRLSHNQQLPHPACRGGLRDSALPDVGVASSSAESREPLGQAQWGGAQQALTPILAHELLHIRRGDLWVGLLQTLAQAVWWCHPLVWWLNRLTTREAERCCDEEVLAELGCDPAAYARALVDVLELKRELKPVPVFPGVRPVEVTSQRLERIMELGQGCRRRTPWWCWLLAALAAGVTWPGAAFVVTADDAQDLKSPPTAEPPQPVINFVGDDKDEAAIERLVKQNAERKEAFVKSVRMLVFETEEILRQLPGTDAEKKSVIEAFVRAHCPGEETRMKWDDLGFVVRAMGADLLELQLSFDQVNRSFRNGSPKFAMAMIQSLTQFPHVGLIYKTFVISGSDDELRQFAKEIDDKLIGMSLERLQPVILDSDQAQRLLKRANLPSRINIASHPAETGLNGRETTIQDIKSFDLVTEVLESEKQVPHIAPLEHGWSLTLNPLVLNEKSLQLSTHYWQKRLNHELAVKVKLPSTGDEQVIPGLNLVQLRADVNLEDGQMMVFPLPLTVNGSCLLALQVQRAKTTDEIRQSATPANPPAARPIRGTGVNSDAGVSGEVVAEEVHIPPERFRATPSGDGAVRKYITSWEAPKFNNAALANELQLDGLGQLLWRHGSWFVVVRPEPGWKLIGGGSIPAKFDSNGPVKVTLTNMQGDGFRMMNQLRIASDEFSLWSDENGQRIQLGGDVRLTGHEFDAKSDSMVLTMRHDFRNNLGDQGLSATLNGHVSLRKKTKSEPAELMADKAVLFLHGSAISQIQSGENGLVAVLREPNPPARDAMLLKYGQTVLAIAASEKRFSVNFDKVPLKDAMEQLAKQSGRNIQLDPKGLEEESLTDKAPVTLKLDGVKLSSVLTLALKPLNLGYRVDESGVIVVTSIQKLRGEPIVMTYSVADLVFPYPKRVRVELGDAKDATPQKGGHLNAIPMYQVVNGNRLEGNPQSEEFAKAQQLRFKELIELFTATCDPNSWQEVGGNGSIKANDSTLSLVVRQTPDVHAQINDLLQQLRRQLDVQASLHTETLTVPQDFWTQVGREFDIVSAETFPNPQPKSNAKSAAAPQRIARLSNKEAALLRSVGRPDSAPKVTLFNGQELDLFFGLEPSAMRLALKPVVSADRTHLRLYYATQRRDKELDFSKLPAVTFADGHSLLLDVTDIHSTGPKAGVPILEKVPDESRLFQNTGKSDHRTLLLITGQVIVAEEEEVRCPEVKVDPPVPVSD